MRGLKRGRDEESYPPPTYKLARREYAADVSSSSGIQHILSPGTMLPLWGFNDADGVLGYIEVNKNKIDIGGSAFILGGQMTDGSHQVALKVFTMPMHDYQVTLIRRELDIVRKLAPHPNILPFLGTCPHYNAVLVSPYMREGNLLKYLRQNPAVNRHKLIVQVAEALSHVHEVHKLVHGDLKCENVLISDNGDALLADFGLSTAIEKAASDVTTVSDIRQKSTFRFNAPELMLGSVTERDGNGLHRARSKTTATDVYAFGMLLLQAYTEQRPWAEYKDDIQIITAVCITKRMHTRPDSKSHAVAVGFTDQHWNVCSSCWNYEPHDRPTIRHVLFALVQSPVREEPMWSRVQAFQVFERDPTGTYRMSSRPERNKAITTERVAYSGQHAPLNLQQPEPSSLPILPQNVATQFQGELQAAWARITRPLYETMHTQYMAQYGVDMNPSKRPVEGRTVDLFELHQAHFHARGIGRQLPDDMWQLIAGNLGFGQAPDNLRATMSTAHTIKNIYENYLRDFNVALEQRLLVSYRHWQQIQQRQQPGAGGFSPGGVPPQNAYAPSPHPGQPRQIQQLHGGPPFILPPPQGAVNPQQLAQQQQQQQFDQFRQGMNAFHPPATTQAHLWEYELPTY